MCPPRCGWRPRGPAALPSPLCRTLGPQLAWGTGKARYLAPSRETPEVRDEPPSPCPRFMMFALSLLRETTSGADTSGPASLGPGTSPNPPHPALLAHALTHKVSHFHTHLCQHRSTAPHPSCTPRCTHTRYLHSFPHIFHAHSRSRDLILLTH